MRPFKLQDSGQGAFSQRSESNLLSKIAPSCCEGLLITFDVKYSYRNRAPEISVKQNTKYLQGAGTALYGRGMKRAFFSNIPRRVVYYTVSSLLL